MALINESVGFCGPLDLIEIWRELDIYMLQYYAEQREKDAKRKAELAEKAGKQN
jgi:hypothetical protein